MSASLVGSEMCIRDSLPPRYVFFPNEAAIPILIWMYEATLPVVPRLMAVSYTHLTLPTICSV
eukprot:13952085-Alexandrium_andersonii.AAC.1